MLNFEGYTSLGKLERPLLGLHLELDDGHWICSLEALGFRAWGLGFRVWGLGFGFESLGFGVLGWL